MITSRCYILKIFIIFLVYASLSCEVIIVNSNLDDQAMNPFISPATSGGVVTLRSAIQYSNAISGSNTINFDIAGVGPFTIAVGTGIGVVGEALPPISTPLIVNGYTQPDATVATLNACSTTTPVTPANLLIILNGGAVNTGVFQDGLTLITGSDASVIEGLVIQDFPQNGINIQDGNNQRIVGNYIGINHTGLFAVSNQGNGVNIASGVSGVIIGSTNVADRNIISGQDSTSGATPVSGVGVFSEGLDVQIVGNYIGVDAAGIGSIPNRTGVYVFNPIGGTSLRNIIKCNIINHNDGRGAVEGFGVIINGAVDNPILSNSIFNNDKSGIFFINDGNDNLPAPVLTTATASGATIKVNGTLSSPANPNATFRIEFFVNSLNRTPITEGQTFVGDAIVITDGSGNAAFNNIRLPSNANPGQFVSATATLLGVSGAVETSTFAPNLILAQGSSEGSLSFAIYRKYCNRNDLPCNTPAA